MESSRFYSGSNVYLTTIRKLGQANRRTTAGTLHCVCHMSMMKYSEQESMNDDGIYYVCFGKYKKNTSGRTSLVSFG